MFLFVPSETFASFSHKTHRKKNESKKTRAWVFFTTTRVLAHYLLLNWRGRSSSRLSGF